MRIQIITVLKENHNWLPKYVTNLKKALDNNLTIPFDFFCISNSTLNDEIIQLPLLPLHGEHVSDRIPGFWYKPQMFRKELNFTENCLYIDIDTIIKGNIDHLIYQFSKYKFLMGKCPWRSVSSSFLMWWNGDFSYLWEEFQTKPVVEWNQKYSKADLSKYGDQGFVSERVNHFLIQDIIDRPIDLDRIRKTENILDSKILICSGKRKPWMMLHHPDVINYWNLTP